MTNRTYPHRETQKRMVTGVLVFALFYLAFFSLIENRPEKGFVYLFLKIDEYIPFCEYFVVPYIFWGPWMAFIIIHLIRHDETSFKHLYFLLASGMTIFLLFSYFVPTKIVLRPQNLENRNLFCYLTDLIYSLDTPTNTFPSIHVFNTVAILAVMLKSRDQLFNNSTFRHTAVIISVSIILSTVFIKQHSLLDVFGAFIMFILLEKVYQNIVCHYNEGLQS